jgi:ubiquinone/menaquinone biosynthesis C-methylase UbiE
MTREQHREAQAAVFDRIGTRYDEAFPHKEGQEDAGKWLLERLSPGAHVLDVGCGTGLPSARQLVASGMRVTGIDISPVMLEIFRQHVPEARFIEMDVVDVDAGLGRFDAAIAFFSLLMLPRREIELSLRNLHDVLVPGGWLSLSMVEIDMDDVSFQFLGSPVRISGYLRDDLRAVLEEAGFDVADERIISYAPSTTQAQPEIQLFLNCRRRGR